MRLSGTPITGPAGSATPGFLGSPGTQLVGFGTSDDQNGITMSEHSASTMMVLRRPNFSESEPAVMPPRMAPMV